MHSGRGVPRGGGRRYGGGRQGGFEEAEAGLPRPSLENGVV